MEREWGDLNDPLEFRALCLKWAREDGQNRNLLGEAFEKYMLDRMNWYLDVLSGARLGKKSAA